MFTTEWVSSVDLGSAEEAFSSDPKMSELQGNYFNNFLLLIQNRLIPVERRA